MSSGSSQPALAGLRVFVSYPRGGRAHTRVGRVQAALRDQAPAKGLFRADVKHDGTPVYSGGGDETPYAAAITTSATALWLARHRDALSAAYPNPWQRVQVFKSVARSTAVPMPNQKPGSFGAGIIDIGALLSQPLPSAASLQPERPA